MLLFPELPATKADLVRGLLRDKRTRDAARAFVIEGVKPIRELLAAGKESVRLLVVTETFLETCEPRFRRVLESARGSVYQCPARVFSKLADVVTPLGILAAVAQPRWDLSAILARPRLLGLYGECIQDPANVGAIIRTAGAFGLDAVWLTKDSADVFNPKVVRATAGMVLRVPTFTLQDTAVFEEHACSLLAAQIGHKASRAIHEITELPSRAILAFGNESRGLSQATLKQAAVRFNIPIAQGVESLNVAASAAIAAFYFRGLAGNTMGRKG